MLWKHNKSDKHTNNHKYEQVDIYDDIVEKRKWLFREKQVRGFLKPLRLKNRLENQYNIILFQHNPIDLNSDLKLVGKNNQNI